MLEGSFELVDWLIVIAYFIGIVIVGLLLTRRGSESVEQFFVSGRGLPWWLAGISISATSLACDTPLWITDMVRQLGVQAIWYEWAPAWGGVISIFITSRLLRRSRIVTDAELSVVRYGGRVGVGLRVYLSAFYAVFFSSIVMGWVLAAMGFWGEEVLGWNKYWSVIGAAALAASYSIMAGLWGVVLTDFFQFIVATAGGILLMVFAVQHVGGISEMAAQLHALSDWPGNDLHVLPRLSADFPLLLLITYFGVQWVSSANPALYGAQRVLACRSERDASLALLANVILRHALNIWPWVIVALCSLIIFPDIEDNQYAYPRMVVTLLPTGIRGLMIAAILAAFMSTIDTLLNWGSSYLVNDVYRAYLKKDATQKHYVLVSRIAMGIMACCGVVLGLRFESILGNLQFVGGMVICYAPVMVLRWYWWRINAWSEISAVTTSAVVALLIQFYADDWGWVGPSYFGHRVVTSMIAVACVWIPVTFLTRPVAMETLEAFYRRVRPVGAWGPVRRRIDAASLPPRELPPARVLLAACVSGVALVYGSVFMVGKFLLGYWIPALVALVVVAAAASYVGAVLRRIDSGRADAPSRQALETPDALE